MRFQSMQRLIRGLVNVLGVSPYHSVSAELGQGNSRCAFQTFSTCAIKSAGGSQKKSMSVAGSYSERVLTISR